MTDETPKIKTIRAEEISASHLSPAARLDLRRALNTTLMGYARLTVCFTYANQTGGKKAKPGRDYIALPGVERNTMIGDIISVGRAKADGRVYFRLNCLTRSTGEGGSVRSFRPEGVLSFVVLAEVPKEQEENA